MDNGQTGPEQKPALPGGLTPSIARRCLGRNGRTSKCMWFFLKRDGASSDKGFPTSPALCLKNRLLQVCFELNPTSCDYFTYHHLLFITCCSSLVSPFITYFTLAK